MKNKRSPVNIPVGYICNQLTVVGLSHKDNWGHNHYVCACSCGRTFTVVGQTLRRKKQFSCKPCSLLTHGMSNHRVHHIWRQMKNRCNERYSTSPWAKQYAGRCVKVCDRWLNSFADFYADMGDPPTETHTLDRIDNDGDYTPTNCRWATRKEQANNTSRNRKITIDGETKTLSEWCDVYKMPYISVCTRLRRGMGIIEALTKSNKRWVNTLVTLDGMSKTIKEWSIMYKVPAKSIKWRLDHGWALETSIKSPINFITPYTRKKGVTNEIRN